jgi:DNA repair protein RadC
MHALRTLAAINGRDPDETVILQQALTILDRRSKRADWFITNKDDASTYVRLLLAEDPDREHFLAVYLDNRHGVINSEILFHGTVDGAAVHPRIVLQRALHYNACAVVLAHNHPSGDPEPSQADQTITNRIRDALVPVDVRVLDHLVVGEGVYSFAEHGRL